MLGSARNGGQPTTGGRRVRAAHARGLPAADGRA
jgi:hypothetical protein